MPFQTFCLLNYLLTRTSSRGAFAPKNYGFKKVLSQNKMWVPKYFVSKKKIGIPKKVGSKKREGWLPSPKRILHSNFYPPKMSGTFWKVVGVVGGWWGWWWVGWVVVPTTFRVQLQSSWTTTLKLRVFIFERLCISSQVFSFLQEIRLCSAVVGWLFGG